MEALQWILSAGTSFFEGIQLSNDLDRLRVRATLPKARMLICRSEWGMFKDKQLAKLLSHLKDTTYDAEDLLRQLDDQVLRQSIEDTDRSRAGQLLSSSLNFAKTYIRGSKGRIKETQKKLDKVVAEIEGMPNLMGLMSVESSQIMPETTSIISAPEVVGREAERNELIEMHRCVQLKNTCLGFIASRGVLGAVVQTSGFCHLVESCPLVLLEILDKLASLGI